MSFSISVVPDLHKLRITLTNGKQWHTTDNASSSYIAQNIVQIRNSKESVRQLS